MTATAEPPNVPWGLPALMTADGAALETMESVPAGPWLAHAIDEIDVDQLSDWDMPAYLRACARVQAWAAARLSDGIAELASRPGGFGCDKEVALALREPVGAAQRRVHHAKRLRRMLPETRRLHLRGDLGEKHVNAMIEATSGVDDPELVSGIEGRVFACGAPAKTAQELHRHARRTLTRLDPQGTQERARAATAKAVGGTRRVGVLRAEGLGRICSDYLAGVAEMIATELPKLRLMVIDETSGRLVHRAVDAYRPTAAQVAQLRAEYVYSLAPGSQVLAGRTDTDHAIPYPDGPTQIGNLLPDDRTWHNGHTRKQLSVTVDDSGSVTWTSVLGQSRTVDPYDYRLEPEPPEASEEDPPSST